MFIDLRFRSSRRSKATDEQKLCDDQRPAAEAKPFRTDSLLAPLWRPGGSHGQDLWMAEGLWLLRLVEAEGLGGLGKTKRAAGTLPLVVLYIVGGFSESCSDTNPHQGPSSKHALK